MILSSSTLKQELIDLAGDIVEANDGYARNFLLKKGLAKEISESGQLQVEFEDKHTIWLNSGEISLTSW